MYSSSKFKNYKHFANLVSPISPCVLSPTLKLSFGCLVVSDSLQPHGSQHARLLCPSPSPGVCSDSCPSSRWCHPTISSFVVPSSPWLQSFPASGSFPMSQFFASGGQSIGASNSALFLPVNIQDGFPLGLTGLISLKFKGLSSLLQHHNSEVINSSALCFLYGSTLTSIHDYWKNHSLD